MICYEIFKFEIKYRAKRIETYLYFVLLFFCALGGFDGIMQGQDIGLDKENAPYIIAKIMAIFSGLFMVITSLVMGVPIIRDFEYQMESLMFVNPIDKRDYLLGRFLGSFVVLVLIFTALIWGLILGEYMPWRNSENLLPFNFWYYLHPFFTFVIPNLFFGGSLFFVSGALSRNLILVYTQGVFFFVTIILSRQIENPLFSALVDPFSFGIISDIIQSWSLADRNSLLFPVEGYFLYNRIFWLLLSLVVLAVAYFVFDFNVVSGKGARAKEKTPIDSRVYSALNFSGMEVQEGFWASAQELQAHALFYFKLISKEASFWSIVLCGMFLVFINSMTLGTLYGVDSLPATYLIVEELQESSMLFFLVLLIFYSGELIWKERGLRFHLIYDALPTADFVRLAGKFLGLLYLYVILLLVLIFSGVLFQTLNGFYDYNWKVYFSGFFLELFPFLLLFTLFSFFVQVLVNSKFVGYLLVFVFFLSSMIIGLMGISHPLLVFGGIPLGRYSEMNGFGHFLYPYLCFKGYWFAFGILLFALTTVFDVRGMETNFRKRWQLSKNRWSPFLIKLATASFMLFILMGSFIFYNTNILNEYRSSTQKYQLRADYEKELQAFKTSRSPQILAINLDLELYPQKRNYTVTGTYLLTNPHDQPISSIQVQKWLAPQINLEEVAFTGGASLDDQYEEFGFYKYRLHQALQANDSIQMTFKQTYTSNGFVDHNGNTAVVENGSFLESQHFPTLGYNDRYELRDQGDRKYYALPDKMEEPKIAEVLQSDYQKAKQEVHFEVKVGTSSDQRAIAPGTLRKSWKENERNYFHYQVDQPMLNLYSIVSADYEVKNDIWKSTGDSLKAKVDLGIYYHQGHESNLHRMMASLKKSLDYYSTHFSPYQYDQLCITEFPRYREFAQSFANTIPFSEALGFILDIDDKQDADMAFYVTAHEVAHQWWGHQLMVEEVEGWPMIIESLAQYSALMVFQENFSAAKIQQFLTFEMERYLEKRGRASEAELPLNRVGDQDHIYYEKGAVNFFAFQDYIGEESVNLALRQFLKDWNSQNGLLRKNRYATTEDLLSCFRAVTPDSLQYVITDLFETVILYDNKMTKASFEKVGNKRYKVHLNGIVEKYKVDTCGVESLIPLQDWIEIGIYGINTSGEKELIYLKKHLFKTSVFSLDIELGQEPKEVGIDPLYKLIDRKMENNVIAISSEI